jgi:hypothetical protein
MESKQIEKYGGARKLKQDTQFKVTYVGIGLIFIFV